jgi:hypothetical protein
MSYHIKSYISYHITSYHIISHHIISYMRMYTQHNCTHHQDMGLSKNMLAQNHRVIIMFPNNLLFYGHTVRYTPFSDTPQGSTNCSIGIYSTFFHVSQT